MADNTRPTTTAEAHRNELIVLSMIGFGLIAILVLIICGLFGWFESKVNAPLPNWAENVLVSIATATTLKLGDVLAALVTLATGRQVESFGNKLATSTPANTNGIKTGDTVTIEGADGPVKTGDTVTLDKGETDDGSTGSN